jgi:heme A synthase
MKPGGDADLADFIAGSSLLCVFAFFAWICIRRVGRGEGFFSLRLVLAFTALGICAGRAYVALNGGFHGDDTSHQIGQASDHLTGGFVMLAAMFVFHTCFWLLQRGKEQAIDSRVSTP